MNAIAGEKLHFHLSIANPAGTAPTASQIKFLLDGEETPVAVADLGRGRFVLTWTSDIHGGYPEKVVQLASARFTDEEGATAYHNFTSIDVAEWEGMIAGLRTGTGFSTFNFQSHYSGSKTTMNNLVNYGLSSAWYRGGKKCFDI